MKQGISVYLCGLGLVTALGISAAAQASPGGADEAAPYGQWTQRSAETRERLREHWQNLPPQEREAIRQRLREEPREQRMQERREMRERGGFGQGYEQRRQRQDEVPHGGYRR